MSASRNFEIRFLDPSLGDAQLRCCQLRSLLRICGVPVPRAWAWKNSEKIFAFSVDFCSDSEVVEG